MKTIPGKFYFLNPKYYRVFASEVCKFLKKYAKFSLILIFVHVCKQNFHISHVYVPQNMKGVLM